jgi:hypothetical protein
MRIQYDGAGLQIEGRLQDGAHTRPSLPVTADDDRDSGAGALATARRVPRLNAASALISTTRKSCKSAAAPSRAVCTTMPAVVGLP